MDTPDPIVQERSTRRSWRSRWSGLNEWVRAALLAAVVLALLHFVVLRWVTVRSTSMYATLLPGDLIGVARWAKWTGFERGDIAVFRDPVEDRSIKSNRQLLVKRIVGLPGDEVEIRRGLLFVNGAPILYPGETKSYLVRLKRGTDPAKVLDELALAPTFIPPDRSVIELPMNAEMAKALVALPEVLSAEPMNSAHGAPRHIFPFSPYFKWNADNYGPILVPQEGDTVRVDVTTVPMYDRIISRYEGHKLEAERNDLHIDGEATKRYVIGQDYYFVLGDSRHYSADSRYWGFVPADHLVGRAAFILLSTDEQGRSREGRWMKGL
jgi:signal peptidase I